MKMKDLLDIVVIPLILGVLALLPLIWAVPNSQIRRIQLRELTLRELEEVGPYPPKKKSENGKNDWQKHHTQKRFLHKEFLDNPTENREVILSMPSDLVYYVNRLWDSKDNAEQWLYMLDMIEKTAPRRSRRQKRHCKKIGEVKAQWYTLMKEYGQSFPPDFVTKHIPEASLSEAQGVQDGR